MRVDAPRTREVRMPLHIKSKKYKVTSLQSGFLVAIIVLFIDQGSKLLVTAQAEILRGGIPIFPGLNFVFIQNAGVSFGLFGFAPPLVLIIFGILICCILKSFALLGNMMRLFSRWSYERLRSDSIFNPAHSETKTHPS